MGQKVNPNGFRFGVNRNWQSRWIAADRAQTARWLMDDDDVRKLLARDCRAAFIDRVEIQREKDRYDLFVYAATPLKITGPDNANLPALVKKINKIVGRKVKVNVNAISVDRPELSAAIVARRIADEIEQRTSFRIAQKRAIKDVMKAGAKGVRTNVSGRLGGAEIAREEGYAEGQTPLTTLRADVDYALAEAHTPYGRIGCKVWINRGEIFAPAKRSVQPAAPAPAEPGVR